MGKRIHMGAELPEDEYYIHTYTGIKFGLRPPKAENIDILDIAHALSLINRFTGHTRRAMSVGAHALAVYDIVDEKYLWEGLHHDDGEAYYQDLSSPLKRMLGGSYRDFIELIDAQLAKKFSLDISAEAHKAVKEADLRILQAEALYGLGRTFTGLPYSDVLNASPEAYAVRKRHGKSSETTELDFLHVYAKLLAKRELK